MKLKNIKFISVTLFLLFILTSCIEFISPSELANVEYKQESYITVNNNTPQFSKDELTTESFEQYSQLDILGRCGQAVACIGKDIMPTEERESIGQVKPSGWQIAKYDMIDGKYLYNRCHLIGYQLTGENANEKNLITGTRYMNVEGMLPFENMVAKYVESTDNHVMYRVTPIFDGYDLIAKGVQMEAYSVEDDGEGISYNVFVFNVQPGIEINYSDGKSKLIDNNDDYYSESKQEYSPNNDEEIMIYILNTNTKKFHYKDCPSVIDIQSKNKESININRNYLIENGYLPCNRCKP